MASATSTGGFGGASLGSNDTTRSRRSLSRKGVGEQWQHGKTELLADRHDCRHHGRRVLAEHQYFAIEFIAASASSIELAAIPPADRPRTKRSGR